MKEIYLDNCATTPPLAEVIETMYYTQGTFGNPSSLHAKGIEAEKQIEETRKILGQALQVSSGEIIFTSGGTEANNLAVQGLAYRNSRKGKHLVTTPIEHPSVLNAFQHLERLGFLVSYLQVDREGYVDKEHLSSLLNRETTLVSIIYVNNETGTIQEIGEIARLIKAQDPSILVHVDAVQALGKLSLASFRKFVDAFSISAHKIHGPKGAGALWLKEGVHLQPLFQGGDQEKGLRPGTENVPGIVGFGKAVQEYTGRLREKAARLQQLKDRFNRGLEEHIEFFVNGPPPEKSAPHIINLSFPGVKSEVLIRMLEDKGIYSSPGSACHSRRSQASHVLTALGLEKERIEGAVRFSFSVLNSEEDIDYAVEQVAACVKELQKLVY